MITEQEKDAALTVLADYIAQNDINMVGGVFENDVMGEFIVTYGRESALQKLTQDKAELVEFVKMIANGKSEIGESAIIHTRIHADAAKELLEKHKCD